MKLLVVFLTFFSMTLSAQTKAAGGVEFPINNQHSQDFNAWCGRVLDELSWAKQDAMAAYRFGNLADSVSILKNSISAVAEQAFPYEVGALSYKALKRADSYIQSLESGMGNSEKEMRALNLFMHKYIDFIFTVSRDMDIPHYNHRCRSGYCHQKLDDLERKFVQFSFAQVQNVLDSLLVRGPGGIFPKGAAKAYLLALNLAATFAVEDLQSSAYSEYYSCSVRDLILLEQRLADFNQQGSTPYWPSEVFAVRSSFFDAEAILSRGTTHCDTRHPRSYPERY